MTAVLALDLSLTATGVALPDGTTTTLRPGTANPDARLNTLTTDLGRIIEATRPTYAITEGYTIHAQGPLGQYRRAEWVGCARLTLRRHRIPLAWVNPSTLKLYATGHGHAPKEAMVEAAIAAGGKPANHDEADAFLLWTMARLVLDDLDPLNDAKDRIRRLHVAGNVDWPKPKELTA